MRIGRRESDPGDDAQSAAGRNRGGTNGISFSALQTGSKSTRRRGRADRSPLLQRRTHCCDLHKPPRVARALNMRPSKPFRWNRPAGSYSSRGACLLCLPAMGPPPFACGAAPARSGGGAGGRPLAPGVTGHACGRCLLGGVGRARWGAPAARRRSGTTRCRGIGGTGGRG